MIPGPKKLSIFRVKGSTPNHPITKDEVEAISGPYLEFARTWVSEPVGTSSRAKVEAEDLAIALAILKFCSRKMNCDGTMPTQRIKVIWDQMYENGEVDRAFDYHRWRVIRDLIEVQGGLGDGGSAVLHGVCQRPRSRDQGIGCQVEDGGLADREVG